jgi:hypothetical protein
MLTSRERGGEVRNLLLLCAAALAGCATSGPPLVDMTNVDPVVYQGDLDRCEAVGRGSDAAGPLVVGAIMGASFGAGLGALFAFPAPTAAYSVAEGYGTGTGAVAGAAAETAANAPTPAGAPPAAGASQTVAQCLTAKGYRVIGGGS